MSPLASSSLPAATIAVPCKVVVLGEGGVGKTCLLHSYTHGLEFLGAKQQYIRTVFENYHAVVPITLHDEAGRGEPPCDEAIMQLSLCDTAGQEQYDTLRSMCYKRSAMKTVPPEVPPSPSSSTGLQQNNPSQAGSTKTLRVLRPKMATVSSFDVSVFIVCFSWSDPQSLWQVESKWFKELHRVASDLEMEIHRAAEVEGGKGSASCPSAPSKRGRWPFTVLLCGTKSDVKPPLTSNVGSSHHHALFDKTDTTSTSGAVGNAAPHGQRKGGSLTYEMVHDAFVRLKADAYVECSAKTGAGIQDVMATAMRLWYQRVAMEHHADEMSAGDAAASAW
eukprot:CAMPEP_0176456988 /NCGR_PEP_ID=MMETSP0127-20121128/31639_1 /TAXON_ID=938130 /ORGANISM="Platyophrya macrostoma, Strain WH" /LENGTH=334 /DNA_ID=CAMNT_0017847099 /DNA_START=21 /DNA_END=1022 /DNA_ORIENTATION=+